VAQEVAGEVRRLQGGGAGAAGESGDDAELRVGEWRDVRLGSARYSQCRMNRSGKLYEDSRIGVRPSATGMPKSGVPSAFQWIFWTRVRRLGSLSGEPLMSL
jgi:hypothetical protein